MKFPVWLFTNEIELAKSADAAGIGGVVVDWEWIGKEARQSGHDTEISRGTGIQLERIRAVVRGRLACRINNLPGVRAEEVRRAAGLGANEIWLPMVRAETEVEEVLAVLPRNCRLTILAETPEAHSLAGIIDHWPIERVYFGLNDFAISTGRPHLFSALADGTLEEFRSRYRGPFGFGGVTHPEGGQPIRCRDFLGEMARLGCSFGVARRTFRREVPALMMPRVLADISHVYGELCARSNALVESDRKAFVAQINTVVETVSTEKAFGAAT